MSDRDDLEPRYEALSMLATGLGLDFAGRSSAEELDLDDLPFVWRMDLYLNVLRGRYRGIEIVAFDWVTGPGSYGGYWEPSQASCAVSRLVVSCPTLRLVPRRPFRPFGSVRVGDESLERRFRIEARDRGFARTVLDPGMRAMLLGPDGRGSWLSRGKGTVSFELAGRWLACSSPFLEPADIPEGLLEPLRRFREHLPANVRGGAP